MTLMADTRANKTTPCVNERMQSVGKTLHFEEFTDLSQFTMMSP